MKLFEDQQLVSKYCSWKCFLASTQTTIKKNLEINLQAALFQKHVLCVKFPLCIIKKRHMLNIALFMQAPTTVIVCFMEINVYLIQLNNSTLINTTEFHFLYDSRRYTYVCMHENS